MSLWWIPAGIAAWFLISVVVGLCIGPVLGRCSEARGPLASSGRGHQTHASRPGRTGRSRRDGRVRHGYCKAKTECYSVK